MTDEVMNVAAAAAAGRMFEPCFLIGKSCKFFGLAAVATVSL